MCGGCKEADGFLRGPFCDAASSSRPLGEFGIVSHKGKQVFGTQQHFMVTSVVGLQMASNY